MVIPQLLTHVRGRGAAQCTRLASRAGPCRMCVQERRVEGHLRPFVIPGGGFCCCITLGPGKFAGAAECFDIGDEISCFLEWPVRRAIEKRCI